MSHFIRTYFHGLSALLILVFYSCTEVINFDFKSADEEIVVEARVPELDFASVRLTRSVQLQDSVIFPGIDDAVVTISDNAGNSEVLKLKSPGLYKSALLRGIPGYKYNLNIKHKELEINATDSMPHPVRLSKLIVRKYEFAESGITFGSDSTGTMMEVVVHYTDPVNQKNNYRFIETVNGKVINTYLSDDKFNNGKLVHMFLININRRLNVGDTLSVEMQSVTDEVYNCFDSNSITGGGSVFGSPSNPVTNLKGVKLGYFSAYGSHTRRVILTPDYFD
jgi:hypothetical protein